MKKLRYCEYPLSPGFDRIIPVLYEVFLTEQDLEFMDNIIHELFFMAI